MLKLPKALEEPVQWHHKLGSPLPPEYSIWHAIASSRDLTYHRFQICDWIVLHDRGLINVDDFLVRELKIARNYGTQEKPDYKVHTIRWHESGAWFEKKKSEWVPFLKMESSVKKQLEEMEKMFNNF